MIANFNTATDKLVKRIFQEHRHQTYEIDISAGTLQLNRFTVCSNVLRPELVTSIHLAIYLADNTHLYKNKVVMDMGCGCGIQGIVMGLLGAKHVYFSDISSEAVKNTELNVQHFNLSKLSHVLRGDLFESFSNTCDLIVFNQPFFEGEPIEDIPVSRAILDSGTLIHCFLDDAVLFSKRIIMPFYKDAGYANDPGIQAPKHGYTIVKSTTLHANSGYNLGEILIYELLSPD